jgi:hypothetical protein
MTSVDRQNLAVSRIFEAYCEAIDGRKLETLADVFTGDCCVRFGEVEIVGFSDLLDFLGSGLARFEATRHVVSDIVLEPAGPDRIRSVSKIRAWHRFVKDRPDLTIIGRYRNLFVHTSDGWRIAEHRGSEDARELSERSRGPATPRSNAVHLAGRRRQAGRRAP